MTNRIFATFNTDGFVSGFWQSDACSSLNAIPGDAIEITQAQFDELYEFQGFRKWVNGSIVVYAPPIGTPEPRLVLKRVIVDRLFAAGKLDAARAALDARPLYVRERWNVRDSVYATDPDTIALLTGIGADPAVILAP